MIPVGLLLVAVPLIGLAALFVARAGARNAALPGAGAPESEEPTQPSIPIPYTLRPPPPSVCGARQVAWMALSRDERVRRISRYHGAGHGARRRDAGGCAT